MTDPFQTSLVSKKGDAGGQIAANDASLQFITFALAEQEYGVDIMAVREIEGWTATTPIPNAPSCIYGVINLRGIIVPILDLRARFGLPSRPPDKMNVVIIIT